ncbi:hypothetical protein [Pleomorphovibrio marinus]|uniref:hypothetical protein n=1 Tax=Pleomorphovibrio marinus TaxID=2164132 RepID=UPI000E09F18A|nr:hypothetical protein [Pleomorphovibrio marinus]
MTVANLVNESESFMDGDDSIVIVENLEQFRGGRTLDVTGFAPDIIKAGHVIITDGDGVYKPMPLNGGGDAYAALPEGHSYVGVLVATIRKARPFASIMVRGTVNPVAAPFGMASILAAFKADVPLVLFRAD